MPEPLHLEAVTTCNELKAAITEMTVDELRRRFSNHHFRRPLPWPMLAAAERKTTVDASAPAHSSTNVQVEGVDEADIVKTDGYFTYVMSGRQLQIYRTWPAESTELLHRVDIEGYGKELFLHDGRAIVLSGVPSDSFVPPMGPAVRKMTTCAVSRMAVHRSVGTRPFKAVRPLVPGSDGHGQAASTNDHRLAGGQRREGRVCCASADDRVRFCVASRSVCATSVV